MNTITKEAMIKELPMDERPREKLLKYGVGFLSNGELLSILIGTGTKNTSALMLANRILSLENNGISYLAGCVPEELTRIQGIGLAKACQIIAAIELGKRISTKPKEKRINIKSPQEVANLFMEEMRYLNREFFKVLLLNTKNEIMSIEDTSIGDLNSSVVHPREMFSSAVRRSGNPEPSGVDLDVTRRLVDAGKLLGIKVLDHLIIGDGIFISLKEKMLM